MDRIDLNCDLGEASDGEGIAREAVLVTLVSSVSIACGGHSGNDESMERTVRLALEAGCALGAHPSYPDRVNFGRASVRMPPDALERELRGQIDRLAEITGHAGGSLRYVKPHGALYHDCARDPRIAEAVARASGDLLLMGGARTATLDHWRALGHDPIAEAFADRAYERAGGLRSRLLDGAVILDPALVSVQALGIARDRLVRACDGTEIEVRAQSICLHGDTPGALSMARAVREALLGAGIRIGRV